METSGRVTSKKLGVALTFGVGTMLLFLARPPTAIAGGHDMSRCVTVDHASSQTADFIINNCDATIIVKWTDQGLCSNWQCADVIAAHRKSTNTKMKGTSMIAACLYPDQQAWVPLVNTGTLYGVGCPLSRGSFLPQ